MAPLSGLATANARRLYKTPPSTPARRRPQRLILIRMDALRREDDVAKWRRKNGVARVDRVLRDSRFLPHPRNGGSRGYDIPFRQMIVDAYRAGNPAPEGMRSSVWRWTTNGVAPFRMTGNKPVSALSGQYLLLLVLIKLIWPQANYFECIAFIANQSDDAKVFSEGDVSLALRKLGYTMKVTSLPRSSHCDFTHLISSTAAAADRRARAAPDGGKFTAFPPVVRRAPTAVPTAQDVRVDAERWGGSGGGGCHSWREPERRAEEG